jgi:predicted glycoside hydrolase/deacetylase ChbG (UPF0249 family)
MVRQLIINADGFGFTHGINEGIIESIEKGVVSSISCNVNFPFIQDVEYIIKHYPQVSIGLHLNINVGRPVCSVEQIPSLVNTSGEFWGNELTKKLIFRRIRISELQKECEAQIIKLQRLGVNISHLSGHQNKHLYPGYFRILLGLGKKYGIKNIRCQNRYLFMKVNKNRKLKIFQYYISHPKQTITHWYSRVMMKVARKQGFIMADRLITPGYIDNSEKTLLDTWINIIKSLPSGISEIYCHPGYPDDDLRRYANYVDERLLEKLVLTSSELIQYIIKENVQIISFNQISNRTLFPLKQHVTKSNQL